MTQRRGFPLEWHKHLPQDEKEGFETLVRNSTQVLSRLKTIIEEKVETVERNELRESNYTDPSWAYLQAHRNGKIEAFNALLELLQFLDQRK